MKSRSNCLRDHSLSMALAAIEIYNKPGFSGREQIFSILIVNAWEALTKAKIVKDYRNRIKSIYVKNGNRYKKTKSGTYQTIDVMTAARRCPVKPVVIENIEKLVAVRNAATHLTADSTTLPLLVFSLGSASLTNYAHLLYDWFGINLGRYNFYILPLGFSYPFTSLSAIDPSKEPHDIAAILRSVVTLEQQALELDGFFFTCSLEIALVSATKATISPDLVAKIDPTATARIVQRNVNLLDRYPYSYTEACDRIRNQNSSIKQTHVQGFIKAQQIKGDPRYSAYNFRNKRDRERGPSITTPIVYNDDFIRLCVAAHQQLAK